MSSMGRKSPSPFKFNPTWLEEEYFVNLVKEKWVPYDGSSNVSATLPFEDNLKRIKCEDLH